MNAVIIAEISLHALIRHQYQRSSSTSPVPAPVTSSIFHAPAMEVRKNVTTMETMVSRTVVHFETRT